MAVTRVYVGHTTTRQKILGAGLFLGISVLGFLGSAVVGPGIYQAKADKLELSPGSIGSMADGSVLEVTAFSQMKDAESFVLKNEEFGDWTRNSGGMIGDQYYNKIVLKDGMVIAAKINQDAVNMDYVKEEDSLRADFEHVMVTYPVGVMRPWPKETDEKAAKEAGWLTYTEGYVDMQGDFGVELPDLKKLREDSMVAMAGVGFVLGLGGAVIVELLMKKKEGQKSTPQNDQERWILGTYAIWAQFFGQFDYKGRLYAPNTTDSPLYIGGRPKDEDSRKRTIKVLKRDWDIKNRDELLETVEYMSKGSGFWDCETQSDRAWELCRSTQLLGMGFIAGWLTIEELTKRSGIVGNIIQKMFDGWDELAESYLEAFAAWYARAFEGGTESAVRVRRMIYQNLRSRNDSPYKLPWMLPLGTDGSHVEPVREKTGEV